MNARMLIAIAAAMTPLPASALCTLTCWCSVSSTTAVSFGTYNPLAGTPLTSNGNVRVTCGGILGVATYQIALDKGSNASSFNPRQMVSGTNRLNYNLYTDGTYQTIWGDGTGGYPTVPGSVTIVLLGGTYQDTTVYGRIPGGQTTVKPGSYTDTINVTVTYQ